jgi:calcineurin-like phosphoesterase family protein
MKTKTSWVTADPHFSHAGVCHFLRDDGTKLRPWDTPDEMDADMTERWNSVVKPHDRVYVLGDVAINKRGVEVFGRLHGKKVLVKGNHDIFALKDYAPYFEDVRGYKVLPGEAILSHIPIHPESIERFKLNLHGHLHARRVMTNPPLAWLRRPDPRYLCVSVEHTNFYPVPLEDAVSGKLTFPA